MLCSLRRHTVCIQSSDTTVTNWKCDTKMRNDSAPSEISSSRWARENPTHWFWRAIIKERELLVYPKMVQTTKQLP